MKTTDIVKAIFFLSIIIIGSCTKEEQAEVRRESYQGVIAGISEQYVALDEKTITIESFDTTSGVVVLTSNFEIPTLKKNSIIVVDVDTMGYIRKVTTVIEESGKVTVQSEPATMDYLFVDTKFKLSTALIEPASIPKSTNYTNTKTYLEAVSESFTDSEGFIHPVKVIFHLRNNKSDSKSINMLELGKWTDETRKPILDFNEDFSGVNIYKNLSSTVRFYISEGHVILSSDAVFEFDFKGMEEVDEGGENLKIKKGDLFEFKYYLDNNAEALVKLNFEALKVFSDSGKKELLKNVVKTTLKFIVAGVPVWITIDCDIESAYELYAEGSLNATWGFKSTHDLDVGLHYTKGMDISPIFDYIPNNEIYPLVVEGEADLSARFEIYPNIEVKFYGFFGPYCDIVPYLEGELNGGLYYSPGVVDNYFAWNSGIDLGLDLRVGLKLEFLSINLIHLGPLSIHCFEFDLWDSPDSILLLTNVPNEVSSNTTLPLTFKVIDSWKEPAVGTPIYFEGDGSFSKNAVLTAFNGEASVDWMPSSNSGNKSLFAKILDGNGEIIKQINVSIDVIGGATGTVTDIDGNVYNTVTIGSQVWMAENLKTTRFNDNATIPNMTDNRAWSNLTTPGYCWYNNDISNKTTYGALYNWYSINATTNGNKNVCPTGWHVPTDAEWTTLITFMGGENVAGGKLKETGTIHWIAPNTGATNETGFTALPGGARWGNGIFSYVGNYGYWWSASEGNYTGARSLTMSYNSGRVLRNEDIKKYGFSVRCVKH